MLTATDVDVWELVETQLSSDNNQIISSYFEYSIPIIEELLQYKFQGIHSQISIGSSVPVSDSLQGFH